MQRRRQALSSLASMEDERVVSFMEKATSSRSARVRRLEAIMAMGASDQARFAPRLTALLKSRDATTRSHAAIALEKHGDTDTGPAIAAALAVEKKAEVRVNLVRALMVCGDEEAIDRAVHILLKRRTRLDRIAAMWVTAGIPATDALTKEVGKLLKSSSPRVRAAAYFAVGSQKLSSFGKHLKRRAALEKSTARVCVQWALGELEIKDFEGDEDPEEILIAMLPDNHVRAGELEARRRSRR